MDEQALKEIRSRDSLTVGELYGQPQLKVTAFAADDSPPQVAYDRHALLADVDWLKQELADETARGKCGFKRQLELHGMIARLQARLRELVPDDPLLP